MLRSIRYGEADRILHLYTPGHGRVERDRQGRAARRAAASGRGSSRSSTSARCCTRAAGSCYTVTGVDTVAAHGGAARACGHPRRRRARMRRGHPAVRDRRPAPGGVPTAGQRARAAERRPGPGAARQRPGVPAQAAARRGHRAPARRRARCAARPTISAASRAAAGGVVCSSCEAASFPLDEERLQIPGRGARAPLAQAPDGSERALRQVERAIGETAEHHAHVRLRPLLRGV